MGKKVPRVDAHIVGKAAFARPTLVHLRGLVHSARPQVEETMKWGMPSMNKLAAYIKKAAKLNENGEQAAKPARSKTARKLTVPRYFSLAVKENNQAWAQFQGFSYPHRKEYVEWVNGAKTDATPQRRLVLSVAWLADGKSRNWKYESSC